MTNPFDLLKLALGKWVQIKAKDVDITFGDIKIQGKIEADIRISEKLDD